MYNQIRYKRLEMNIKFPICVAYWKNMFSLQSKMTAESRDKFLKYRKR